MSSTYRQVGITLIELLICLTVISIVVCFTTPFTPLLYKKNQLQVVFDDIKGAIRYAKLQTIIRGERLILTHLADETDWSSGMVLYVDNSDGKKQSAVIHEWHWPSLGTHVIWKGFQSNDYLRFESDLNHNAVNGVFLIDAGAQESRRLTVNRFGRVY